MKSILCLLSLLITTTALAAAPIQKSELLKQEYRSLDGKCTLVIGEDESWTTTCPLLKREKGKTTLEGRGLTLTHCFEQEDCEALDFAGATSSDLHAFLMRNPAIPTGLIIGIMYGSSDRQVIALYNR